MLSSLLCSLIDLCKSHIRICLFVLIIILNVEQLIIVQALAFSPIKHTYAHCCLWMQFLISSWSCIQIPLTLLHRRSVKFSSHLSQTAARLLPFPKSISFVYFLEKFDSLATLTDAAGSLFSHVLLLTYCPWLVLSLHLNAWSVPTEPAIVSYREPLFLIEIPLF